jgi:hypothetical protein
MRRRIFNPEKRDLSGVIRWLRDHGLSPAETAGVLGTTIDYVNVNFHRSQERGQPARIVPLLRSLDNRAAGVNEELFKPQAADDSQRSPKNIRNIESKVHEYERHVWRGVRYLTGTSELGGLLQSFSRPAADNIPRLRLLARAYQMESHTYSHGGYVRSGLTFGLEAYATSEYVYRLTRNRSDLEHLAKTVLVISNSFISRRDFARADHWLKIARQAFVGVGRHPDPEYLRQLASIQRNQGDFCEARKNLSKAAEILPHYQPGISEVAVRDMGDRVLFAIAQTPKWDDSQELLQLALQQWPDYDHHRGSNVIWTVACGLLTDSPSVQQEALQLLEKHQNVTEGFALQSTGAYLLSLTPRIPEELRRDWVLFALSYNAYRNE